MFDVNKIREDFPILKEKMAGKPLIYFDNSATALKPRVVIDSIVEYYEKLSTNSHRGDYELSMIVDNKYEAARDKVAKFINADAKEIAFVSGTTEAINLVANSFGFHNFTSGDEIILNYSEHASNILPWYELAKKIDVKIVFCELDNHNLTVEKLKEVVTDKTKLIAFAHVTNTLADVRNIEEICQFASDNNIYTLIDGAQSVPHLNVDVKLYNCDFYAFSAHKMYGPTGIGALYVKNEVIETLKPFNQGGGMNARFDNCLNVSYKNFPAVFEAGTQNIAGVIGFGAAIDYLESIGMDEIHEYEQSLKSYAVSELSKLDNVTIYNSDTSSAVIVFNVTDEEGDEIFPQDVAAYLNTYGIAVRAGDHCAKLLSNVIGTRVTCRASLSLYNTKEEIDVFVDAISKCTTATLPLF